LPVLIADNLARSRSASPYHRRAWPAAYSAAR